MFNSPNLETVPKAQTSLIEVKSTMSTEQLFELTKGLDAVVLNLENVENVPTEVLNSFAKQKAEAGIPVFTVSKANEGMDGVYTTTYTHSEESKNDGVIPLEKVDMKYLDVVIAAIESEYAKGKRGAELGKAVHEKFSYQDDEAKPSAAVETPPAVEQPQN